MSAVCHDTPSVILKKRYALSELQEKSGISNSSMEAEDFSELISQTWARVQLHTLNETITEAELSATVMAIERNKGCLQVVQDEGGGFITHDITLGLHRSLYVSPLGHIYINLKRGSFKIDPTAIKGSHKLLTRSLLYGEELPIAVGTTTLFEEYSFGLAKGRIYSPEEMKRVTRNEHKFSELLAHVPNVVQYREIVYYTNNKGVTKQALYMPFYNKGNLAEYLDKDLDMEFLHQVTVGLFAGLCGIHERGVIHRDIKFINIMLNEEDTPEGKKVVVYYIDLGFAILESDLSEFDKYYGTQCFIPAEVTQYHKRVDPRIRKELERKISTKLDIYSLGIVLGKLWLRLAPQIHQLTGVVNDNYRYWTKPKDFESLDYLIWKMTRDDPEDRPTAQDALQHYHKAFELGLAKQKTYTNFDLNYSPTRPAVLD